MSYPSLKKLVKRTCEAWFEVVALNDLAEDELRFLQARPSRTFDASLAVERRRDFFVVEVTGVSARRFFAPVVGTGVCSSTAGVSGIEASAGVVGRSSAGVEG
ncbi:hypothetical protein PsorP6_007744 [Peronosclerospora sorghi]|uniref:Uncharacterized protein n=1 Tax=Peronosclerospora sorghi TaxID=230839 RepID=A0ACC0W9I1_9STRA|nr:hypothetical protein PsorP6_007744 [Peronosclerospora sorghi]